MRAFLLSAAVAAHAAPAAPVLLTLNASLVAYAKEHSGEPPFARALAAVMAAGTAYLTEGPWSVVDANYTPPSGDMHDYTSFARYGWPCNSVAKFCSLPTPDGCNLTSGLPWFLCDGVVNPYSDLSGNGARLFKTNDAVQALAAAYTFSGDARFAARAALIARAWYVTPATRMNPNLRFAQSLPPADGEWFGVMDLTTNFARVLDALTLIWGSGAWTAADEAGLVEWCTELVAWLETSKAGRNESQQSNNHQTHYRSVTAACKLRAGDARGAAAVLLGALEPPPAGGANAPLGVQVWADGELPAEQIRTNSLGYFNFDLTALFWLGQMSRAAPIAALGTVPDVLTYVTRANASSIRGVVDFLAPFVAGKSWPWQNIDNWTWTQAGAFENLRRAAHAWGDARYAALADALPGDWAEQTSVLWWPWPLVAGGGGP